MLRLTCLVLAIVLAGCGDRTPPPPSMEDTPDAARTAELLEQDLRGLHSLNGNRRAEAERAFGPRLRRDLEACRGTRYENKPLYMLAQWTLVHGGPDAGAEVLPMLDRLEILPAPAYRNAGKALRVQALLRLGRLAEARQLAEALERELPALGALTRVRWYEMVGQAAPAMPGTAVGGEDPPSDAFVLVCFIAMPDADAEAWLAPLRGAAGAGVHIIAVATAGDLLAAASVASAWGVDVRWVRQGDPATAAWNVPSLPTSILLGPGAKRMVLAVDPTPADLARVQAVRR